LTANTRSSYLRAWTQFVDFMLKQSGKAAENANTGDVASFIAELFEQGFAATTIASKISALSFVFKLLHKNDPTGSFVISKLLAGARTLRPTLDDRIPLSYSLLRKILPLIPKFCPTKYTALLYQSMALLAFHCCLRVSEYIKVTHSAHALQLRNVYFQIKDSRGSKRGQQSAVSLDITFTSHKFSKPGHASKIHIPARRKEHYCPVDMLHRFCTVQGNKPGPLFVQQDGAAVTHAEFMNVIHATLKTINQDSSKITSHSFRIGGAVYAFEQGLNESQIQELGRWRSAAFRGYLRGHTVQSYTTK